MSTTSTPRSARFDLPPAPTNSTSTAPDTGLTEWTNKIRAMQRQVDADDEVEQRRLEEEIMRARLARMRRSRTGQSGDFGLGMHGIDLSKLPESDLGTASSAARATTALPPKPAMKPTSTGAKTAPMSLAAFMGGNATGPRLRRHEPQMDPGATYDGRVDHGSVHPIFGRGGIAMPGMVTREADTPSAPTSVPQSQPSKPASATLQTGASEGVRARTLSTSNVARRYVEKIEEQATHPSSSNKLSTLETRDRRQSTPHGGVSELKVTPTPSLSSRLPSQHLGGGSVPPPRSPITESRPKTPSAVDLRPKIPTTSEARPRTPAADAWARTAPVILEARSKTVVDEPRAKTPGTDTARAKTPVQPSPTRASFPAPVPWQTPRHQPSPQLPSMSAVPPRSPGPPSPVRGTHAPQPQRGMAPGFLRPPGSPSKDPTPSISRLQGRGFVQSIVQASDKLSGDTQGSPSASPRHVFPSSSPVPSQSGSEGREKGTRRGSVLDRWNPVMNANGSGAPSPPLPMAKNGTPTRSHTAHASVKAGQDQDVPVVKTHDTGRSVRSAASLPSMPKMLQKKSDGAEQLGSSSTMISYIKPIKTGDDPVVPDVDELGVRAAEGGVQSDGVGTGGGGVNQGAGAGTKGKTPRMSVSPLPSSPGKPLSHPTKDRAKKPRKARFEEARQETVSGVSVPSTDSGTDTAQAAPPLPGPPVANPSDAPALSGPGTSQSSTEPAVRISPSGSTGKITDRWTEPMLIGVKPTSSPLTANRGVPGAKVPGTASMVERRALPGLANPTAVAVADKDEKPPSSRDKDEPTTSTPSSPPRHTRIPSTGNRALVMEVAQALSAAAQQEEKEKQGKEVSGTEPAPTLGLARQLPSSVGFGGPPVGEKRKPSFERYSAIVMPPLAEERTPAVTPVGTLARSTGQAVLGGGEAVREGPMSSLRVDSARAVAPSPASPSSEKVHIDHVDAPLPKVNVAALLTMSPPTAFTPNPDLRTVSVEVMTVVHTSAVPVSRDANVFYDAEVLLVVHRAKSRESGLVVTKVWCWKGKKCHFGEREERKIAELARRYGTLADMVDQQREPAELVYVLGGQLAIRQGTRAHWSSENTAMHVVRSSDGHVLIDEIDLNIRNLCSGYSYCISVLDNIYVWHGCGSVPAERTAALQYAQDMAATGTSVKELVEGENDRDDEMFWMVVGDTESYAKADYWRWRHGVAPSEPRCWLVDVADFGTPIHPVPTLFAETVQQASVYIIDCSWEFFVLVGKDARAKRSDITLAINTAMTMAPLVATSKSFSPTVHVLILPTRLPLDMRHAFRHLDELALNGGFVPDHMNILSTTDAIAHLRTSSWDRSALRDHTMLPLGLDSSHVPLP